ncbi:hypothetical protein SUGI_0577150 [Cryptomeria japonica]|uniref:BTB/POZ domain-containing protein POB1-like n=1 Tax=Cryptomeria japonica TaxID=3369 RepID=UPI002408D5ED|nr:BTB/POZ domain-containing protein POB1-like [Cryptomeria japonica]GLJ29263.1 hypothetical protein SUGI_0577150 [Cryptomeria japonica]
MAPEEDFSFAFDKMAFSDRLLRIEIMSDVIDDRQPFSPISTPDTFKDPFQRSSDDQLVNNISFDVWLKENDPNGNSFKTKMDCFSPAKVINVHVSSAILAVKSPYFYNLFSNGTVESKQRVITLHLSCADGEAFMDLLNFMYCGKPKTETSAALLDLLMVANKFEVASCVHHCIDALSPPTTVENALLFLDLPPNMCMVDGVQPLIIAAKRFLVQNFRMIQEFEGEIPLPILQEILSSDELQVRSEDILYDFVMEWTRKHYPDDDERREVLNKKLIYSIRFPYLSKEKLKEIFSSKEIEGVGTLKLILEALLYKEEAPYRRKNHSAQEFHHEMFCERSYISKTIRIVKIDTPHKECMVFWNIKKDEFLTLRDKPDFLASQFIYFGDQLFLLKAFSTKNKEGFPISFGLCLQMASKAEITVEYIFSCRLNPSRNFVMRSRATDKLYYKKMVGSPDLLGMNWSEFISDSNSYFIDNVLYLRILLILKT